MRASERAIRQTPMVRHGAQADNLPHAEALRLLDAATESIRGIRIDLAFEKSTAAKRDQMRRALSRMLADFETIRLSLK
jgi:hypothetical protein